MATRIHDPRDAGLWLSDDKSHALFDARARELLGISGDEFLRRWDRGEYEGRTDDPNYPKIMRLASLIPFGR